MGLFHFCSYFSIYASLCFLFFGKGICSVGGNETDQQALLMFKAGIAVDPFQVMASWNGTTHFCQWYGVTCGRRHKRVTILNLTSSKLVGTISPYTGNLSFLKVLDLKNNSFTQNIPLEIGRLQRLQEMHLNNNSLTKEIPSNISKCSNLIVLTLGWNSLSGQVPMELGYLSKLQYLTIHFNNLTGTIPHSLGNLSSLGIFSARSNNFVGNIPDTFRQLKNLTALGLFENNLSGIFPYSILNLSSLTVFDIGSNINLGGFLPSNLFLSLPNLQFFSIFDNQFTGFIPNSITNASNLDLLQLNKNNLTGKVPSFERLNIIRVFRIDTNSFGDDLAFLCTLTNSSILEILHFQGNNFGVSLPECIGNLSSKLQQFTGDSNQISGKIPHSIGNLVNLEILFLSNNKLSGKSFMAECEALRNIKHRNLLKILSACSSIDYQGNDFKALVYEFMVNGNLEEWLHKQVGDRNLNLIQRINIAIDVAFAIEYLHHHSGTPIIHCDLKPSNVLLDDEMVARIGDFGLAKFLLHDIQNSSTNQSSSAGLRGTVGYAPPEYGLGSEVSIKGDVYSYGILLLEIFTGKRPTDKMFQESWNLHKFVESAIPNGVSAIVDPTLIEERGQMDEKFRMECLISLLGIGVSCSVESPTDRMDICDVATKLQRIKDNLEKSQQ